MSRGRGPVRTPGPAALPAGRPFTRQQALASGVTDGLLRGPTYRRLFRGIHVHRDVVLSPTVFMEAALLLHPSSAFVSHHSAADLYRLPVPDHHETHVSVFASADRRRHRGIRTHLAVADAAVTSVLGLRVSAPTQMFLELATSLHLVDLVVLGDAMVRRGLVTPEELRAACAGSSRRGADVARRAAGLVREHVDSPMESRLRMLIVLAGLPEPVVDHRVRRHDGSVALRLDLSYPDLRIVIEYDGQQHRGDLDQWDRDIDRDSWFDDGGWKVVKVVARGIYRRPDETIDRVRRVLAARGVRTPALSDEWRAYFPVRP